MSSKINLKLDWCSYRAAKFAVERWHYSKTLPRAPIISIGVWENTLFIGCIVFSRGASPFLLFKYSIKMTEGCELTRVALTKHFSSVSRILSIAIKMLKKKEIGLRLIVSFADSNQGHLGGIYQAGNWIFSGETKEKFSYIDKRGHKWHDRLVSKTGFVKANGKIVKCPKPEDCESVREAGKYRYLMPLDKQMRKQILPLAKPYPKRLTSKDSVARPVNIESDVCE